MLGAGADAALESVLATTAWAESHVRHVRRLALVLFESLADFHGLGSDARDLLSAAALLHDVGYPVDPARHHKISARMIRMHLGPPFSRQEAEMIALIARYHRKSPPKLKHRRYGRLSFDDQRLVSWLAGILRVADGLDRGHDAIVHGLATAVVDGRMEIRIVPVDLPYEGGRNLARVGPPASVNADWCATPSLASPMAAAAAGGMRKRDLLERVLGMPVMIWPD